MTKEDFAAAVSELNRGDRIRLQLREGCFRQTDQFDGSCTGKVLETGPGFIRLAVAREGSKIFTFYPLASITKIAAKRASR